MNSAKLNLSKFRYRIVETTFANGGVVYTIEHREIGVDKEWVSATKDKFGDLPSAQHVLDRLMGNETKSVRVVVET